MFTEIPSDDSSKSQRAKAIGAGYEASGNAVEIERQESGREDSGKSVSRRQIARLIGSSESAFYVLDELDVVVFVNEAMVQIAGDSGEHLLGVDCGLDASRSAGSLGDAGQAADDSETKRWKELLAPPPIWDRRSVFVESWGEDSIRVLVPLDAQSLEGKSIGTKSVAGRGSVLAIITVDSLSRLADQVSFALRSNALKTSSKSWPSFNSQKTTDSVDINAVRVGQGDATWIASGNSLKAVALRSQLELAVSTQAATLLVGPQCQSREDLAEWIHRSRTVKHHEKNARISTRAGGVNSPKIFRIDCHLLDEKLLDDLFEVINSEASNSSSGVTLLLVRLDELPGELVLLLDRFLASHTRLQIIATARAELKSLEQRDPVWGRLRLRVEHLQVVLPPIAERLEDLDSMMGNWLKYDVALDMKQLGQAKHVGAPNLAVSNEALDALCAYAWPGSYGELAQVLQEARKKCSGRMIEVGDLPISIRTSLSYSENSLLVEPLDLDAVLESIEKKLIEEAVQISKGNRSSAAKLLNISRARIIRRMQQWGMMPEPEERQVRPSDEELDLPNFEEIE